MELPTIISIWCDVVKSDSFLGSGCLLDRRHILTARHLLSGGGPFYIGLIAGAADRYRAEILATHGEHDAAILRMEAESPLPVSSPDLLQEHRSLVGEPVRLMAISPMNKSWYEASNYSIGGYDEFHGEYELSPDNARGHSGGVVVCDGVLVGLLFARATNDPLCRAVAMHRLYPWIRKNLPASTVWRGRSSSLPSLSLAWDDPDLEPPEIVVIRPITTHGGWLTLTNHGPGSEKVNQMVLVAHVMRHIPDGMAIPVPAFEFKPLHTGLERAWTETGPGQFHFQGPVTLDSNETWELPELSLEWNENDIDSRRQVARLVGIASLSVELTIRVYSEHRDISQRISVALRVLDGSKISSDAGIQALVDALHPKSDSEREELIRRYRDAVSVANQIQDSWNENEGNTREAQRLEEIANESAEVEELQEEVSLHPSEPQPLLSLANRYIHEELPLEAAKTLDRAWNLGLGSAEQLLDFAEMQIGLGNRQRAILALDKVAYPGSDSARYFGLRGEALDDEATQAEALSSYDEAIAREPMSFRWHSGRGLALIGFEDRIDEALHEFDLAIELGADGALIQGWRGIILVNQKKYEEAIDASRKAIALGNTNLSTFDWIAGLMPVVPRRRLLEVLRATLGKEKAE